MPSSESRARTSGPWGCVDFALMTGRSLGSRATSTHFAQHMVILLLLHALYDLFTSIQLQTGLARCLTNFPTVSTLQDCNFTSLSLKTFCSEPTVLAACSPRLLSYTWIALACIRIRFFAGNTPKAGVFMSVVPEKNAKKDRDGGRDRRTEWELRYGWRERLLQSLQKCT